MELDILDSLDDLGYPDSKDSNLKSAIEVGPKSVKFTQLIEWFSKELQSALGLDCYINSISDSEDSSSFLLELSSFLKEIQCPYQSLVSGSISQRLLDVKSRLTLLDYLCTELQAARLLQKNSKKEETLNSKMEVTSNSVASLFDSALKVLDINIDSNGGPSSTFSEMENKISSKTDLILPPASTDYLTEDHWISLGDLYNDMQAEYSIRRELLLTRLDVTLQSFKWGERCQGRETEILNAYVHKRNELKKEPSVKITDVIAAREDIFIIEKTSSAELVKHTKSSLNRILIAPVPDRGGRAKEQRPPVEMPNWSKRAGRGGGDYRGGRGDNRGGRGGGRGGDHRGHSKKIKGHKGGGDKGHFDAAGSY